MLTIKLFVHILRDTGTETKSRQQMAHPY